MRTITTLILCLMAWAHYSYAGCGDISISPVTTNYVTVDANDPCGTMAAVPQATYIGYDICNNSGAPLSDLAATFSVDAGTSPKFTFALAGGQAATVTDPTKVILAPGECSTFYWFVSYVSTSCNQNANWHDKELLVYDISVSSSEGGIPCPSTTTFEDLSKSTLTQITANAGGQVVAQTLSSALGTIELCVDYDFGNTVNGSDLNLQPAGNLDFDAGCFQLIGSEIKYSEVGGVSAGTLNQLGGFTLTGTSTDGTDTNTSVGDVSVCYYFRSKCTDASSSVLPYADTQSGGPHKYTIADEPAPLPVELLDFWGEWDGDNVNLGWETASEENTFNFEVQRMSDGGEFRTIGEVYAVGNTAELSAYSFDDRNPGNDNYYRLKAVDFDGYYEYSPVIRLERKDPKSLGTKLYPNPSNGLFSLSMQTQLPGEATILISDISGQRVALRNVATGEGNNIVPMDMQHLPTGTYIYTVVTANDAVSGKFVIR